MTVWRHARSALSVLAITLNLAFWLVLAVAVRLVFLAWPAATKRADRLLDAIYLAAVRVDEVVLERIAGLRYALAPLALDPSRAWIVLSNHRSWVDIFLLQSLLAREGLAVHFLSKRELLFMPIVGLVLFTFRFPLLRRSARPGQSESERRQADFDALRTACRRAREHPVALACFAEGTRATAARRAARRSPHRHLLPPRVGGFGALCDGLGEALGGVVDCTLVYPDGERELTFWRCLAGGLPEIGVEAERIDVSALPTDRAERLRWLEARWTRKDERIARWRAAHPA